MLRMLRSLPQPPPPPPELLSSLFCRCSIAMRSARMRVLLAHTCACCRRCSARAAAAASASRLPSR